MQSNGILKPTDSELAILQILWLEGPSSVKVVNKLLNVKKPVGYTTTLKIMQIMTDKGLVIRDTSSRKHIYSAAVNESDVQKNLLDQFVDATFRGSAMKLVLQALGNHKVSTEELEKIKQLIRQKETENTG